MNEQTRRHKALTVDPAVATSEGGTPSQIH
jgi:hypothetical protein